MGAEKRTDSGVLHLSIIKGNLMQKSTEDNPEAVKREWKDDDGNIKVKYEVVYSKVSGIITGVEFKTGDFGEQAIIKMSDVDEKIHIYMPTGSRYFSDFAKKLPNIDLTQEIEIMPYDFEGEKGKPVKGMSVKCCGVKVMSYYYDGKKTINGLPQPDKDWKSYDSDDWKIFFMKEKKFLKKAVQGVTFGEAPVENIYKEPTPQPEGDDDIPF